jgi:hypothetical protein
MFGHFSGVQFSALAFCGLRAEGLQTLAPRFMEKPSLTNTDVWMISLTALIAVAGVISATIFNSQLKVMQAQLDEMKSAGEDTRKAANAANESARVATRTLIASQRAWIRAEPLLFDQTGVTTSVAFKIANVGNVPAMNVWPYAWLIVAKPKGPWPLH